MNFRIVITIVIVNYRECTRPGRSGPIRSRGMKSTPHRPPLFLLSIFNEFPLGKQRRRIEKLPEPSRELAEQIRQVGDGENSSNPIFLPPSPPFLYLTLLEQIPYPTQCFPPISLAVAAPTPPPAPWKPSETLRKLFQVARYAWNTSIRGGPFCN